MKPGNYREDRRRRWRTTIRWENNLSAHPGPATWAPQDVDEHKRARPRYHQKSLKPSRCIREAWALIGIRSDLHAWYRLGHSGTYILNWPDIMSSKASESNKIVRFFVHCCSLCHAISWAVYSTTIKRASSRLMSGRRWRFWPTVTNCIELSFFQNLASYWNLICHDPVRSHSAEDMRIFRS